MTNTSQPYPDWLRLKDDLSLIHPLMLKQLKKTMCFIVNEEGRPHAATIVRLPSSEFPNTIEKTAMRLHIGLCRTDYADMFFFYPVIADEKNLWWTETWIFPYEDEFIGPAPDDPLSKESLKRLNLLLNQLYSHTLIVDENDKLRHTRKILFTETQRKGFPKLAEALKEYEGNRTSLTFLRNAINDYLANINEHQLEQQFEALLRE